MTDNQSILKYQLEGFCEGLPISDKRGLSATEDRFTYNARTEDAIEFIEGFSEQTRFIVIAREFN